MAAINNFFFSSKSVEGASASSGASTGASSSNFYVSGINFNTSSGDLTLNRVGLSDLIVNLDDRYLELTGGTLTGALTVSSGDVTVSNGNLAVIGNVTGDNLNISNWDAAYNDKINSASFSGGATNTLTLTQQDGGTVTASFDNTYLTGGSFSNGDLTLNRTFGGSVVIDLDNTNHFEVQSNKGAANGYTPLDSSGLIPQAYLPPVTITETFVVASEAAQLALTAQQGDVAVRTDLNESYILQGTDPSVLGDWQELLSPTDAVQSVNGLAGAVTLDLGFSSGTLSLTGSGATVDLDNWFDTAFGLKTTDNLSEGSTNLYFADSRARGALSFTAGSGAYNSTTGVITIPTNNNQITNGAGYITISSLANVAYTNVDNNFTVGQTIGGNTTINGDLAVDTNTLFVDASTNRVGIGTANPSAKLDVNGRIRASASASFSEIQLLSPSGYGSFVYFGEAGVGDRGVLGFSNGSGDLVYRSGASTLSTGTERMRIDSSGNVGIGTTNPNSKLEVAGNIRSNVSNGKGFAITGGTSVESGLVRSAGTGVALRTSSLDRLTVDLNGNVGIGTASPSAKVHVSASSGYTANKVQSGSHDIDLFVNSNSGIGGLLVDGTTSMAFYTGSTATERMRIDSSGNVGIGGSITSLSDTDEISIFAGTTVVDNRARIELYGPSHATLANQAFIRGEQIVFTSDAASTERMRIDSSGNLSVTGSITATGGNSTEWNTAYDRSLNANPTFNTSTGTLSLPTQGVGSYTANLDGRYALLGSGATRVETLYSNFTQYATETVRASFSVSSAGVYILKGVVYVDASQNGRFSVRVGTSSTGSTATNRLPSNTSMVYDSSGSLDYSAIPFIFRVSLAAGTNYLFFINTSTPNGDPLASAPEQDRSVVNVTSFVEVVTEVQYLPPPPPM